MDRTARSDKWYLGGGDRLLWAPALPVWLDHPGCWDEIHYFNHAIFPCFTWTLLDSDGRPYPLRRGRWRWSPAGISSSLEPTASPLHGAAGDTDIDEGFSGEVTVWENLALTADDLLCCEVTVDADDEAWDRGLHFVAWSAQPDTGGLYVLPDGYETRSSDFVAGPWGIVWTRTLLPPNWPPLELRCRLALDREAESWSVQFSEGKAAQPWWGLTPWSGPWDQPGLPGEVRQSGNAPHGLYYAGVHSPLEPGSGGRDRIMTVFEVLGESGAEAVASEQVEVGAEAVREPPTWIGGFRSVEENSGDAPGLLLSVTRHAWEESELGVPGLRCSDPFLEAAWDHRWYALKLLEGGGGHGRQLYPSVGEGPGYFRVPISYSGHAHMRDLRWRHDPAVARGTLRNFIANQLEDGSFPGRIYHHTDRRSDFYLADWGGAVMALDQVHPDAAFLEEVYEPLTRYAEWFDRERDQEGSGLYDVVTHFETGQEFMSRYMAVHSEADTVGWVENIRLKAVDATVYMYRLKRALARIAEMLEMHGDATGWDAGADRIAEAVRTVMWDPDDQWFSDVDPRSMERTGVKAAVGFYPFMTDIAGKEHLPALWEHLLDPDKFWTPWPVPATSADDPWFDPDARWKGKRMNCPWNGRVWPMTNSHVFEALALASRTLDKSLTPHLADFLIRFVLMLFTDGDPERPNTFEHYHPYTGQACFYRGVDDYMHSWLNDLIVRFAVGFQLPPPESGEADLTIDPLDLGLEQFTCRGIPFRGRILDVVSIDDRISVSIDGRTAVEGPLGEPLTLNLE